ncbi:hypothetical protein B0H66DRAFT_531124 [Apodospora peruviana]|uniref:Uncharacterized protein n=1 Tax=Apodospora peruviana TaxID=516989 RepID=A0AAE0IAW1_9PEZI|nr:hypothetical protein B0H66DRAFT_531124 [Apodospora peruviana]
MMLLDEVINGTDEDPDKNARKLWTMVLEACVPINVQHHMGGVTSRYTITRQKINIHKNIIESRYLKADYSFPPKNRICIAVDKTTFGPAGAPLGTRCILLAQATGSTHSRLRHSLGITGQDLWYNEPSTVPVIEAVDRARARDYAVAYPRDNYLKNHTGTLQGDPGRGCTVFAATVVDTKVEICQIVFPNRIVLKKTYGDRTFDLRVPADRRKLEMVVEDIISRTTPSLVGMVGSMSWNAVPGE